MIPDFEEAAKKWKEAGKSKAEISAMLSLLDRRKFAAMYLKDPATRRQWKVRDYQEDSVNWRGSRKIHRSARSTGKTKDLEICVLNIAMTDPDQEALIGTQRESHLEPLMERLIRTVTTVPDFKNSLKRRPQRSPDYKIEFKNNFTIWGRIAGPFGQNFQAMHVKYQFCEEAQEWTDKAWKEFIPGLNPGGWRWVYGVPNGVRNKFYSYTEDKSYKLFSWSRLLDKSLTADEIEELKRDYGGEGHPDYQHLVLGLHGRRRIASFDYDDYQLCTNKSLHCPVIKLSKDDLKEAGGDLKKLLNFPTNLPFEGEKYLGCDVGYTTDPTEITAWVFDGKYMANFFRVHLEGFSLPDQKEVLLYLDGRHHFSGIGVDRAGIGLGLEQELKKIDSRFSFIVNGFHWGENLVVGMTPDNKEDKRESRSFASFLIESAMKDKTIVFPDMRDREDQYINMTHEVRSNGFIVYSDKGNHIVDADRCALLVKYMTVLKRQEDVVDLGVRLRPLRMRVRE